MAKARVKIKLPTINDRIKKLIKFDRIVFQVTTRLKLLLFENWQNARGADGKKMPALTENYRKKKGKTGRTAIRNFLFSGNMLQELGPVKKTDFHWVLKFMSAQERRKARGNVNAGGKKINMMVPVSDKINQKLQKLAFNLYVR